MDEDAAAKEKERVELEATVEPRDKENVPACPCPEKKEEEEQEKDERANCDSCRILRETATPVVHYANLTQSDVALDRRLIMLKISDKNPENDAPRKQRRLIDRFEESKYWDVIGLNAKWYEKLKATTKKVTPTRMVFRKCVYRLHNTRHFAVPIRKKVANREEVLKQAYEDDRKMIKRNQAYDCVWPGCMHSFRDPQDMRIHYMFDHESVRLFCCGFRYDNYDCFLEHVVLSSKFFKHSTWSARECWGCQRRFVDANAFYSHTSDCVYQLYPYSCPDPLCNSAYATLRSSVEHFFSYHSLQSAGAVVFNDMVYRNIKDFVDDLPLIDAAQLNIAYKVKAVYFCARCNTQFACEKYYLEHALGHKKHPTSWLLYNFFHCFICNRENCSVQRERLMDVVPKLLYVVRNITIDQCHKNPILLIWHLFLTNEYIQILNLLHARLLYEQELAEDLDEELTDEDLNHAPISDCQLAETLDSIIHLFTARNLKLPESQPRKMIADAAAAEAFIPVVPGHLTVEFSCGRPETASAPGAGACPSCLQPLPSEK